VYIVTIMLFLLPCSLLWVGWRALATTATEGTTPGWRMYCTVAALIIASCATLLELVFFFAWFQNGGSPHGMMPSPGLRKVVGRIPAWALFASVALGGFGKGKPRLLNLAWAVALVFVRYAIFMLEMD
jgi:hypothetical protein